MDDISSTLDDMMKTAQKERENSAKIPDLNKKAFETVAEDGSKVVV